MTTWKWWWAIGAVLLTGCASTAPDAVRQACAHQVEDLRLIEHDLLPLVPEATTATFGETTQPARVGWAIRLRAYQVRAEALKAWADGKTFDLAEAQKRLLGVTE